MKVLEHSITPTNEMTVILGALNALRRGDAGVRLPANWPWQHAWQKLFTDALAPPATI